MASNILNSGGWTTHYGTLFNLTKWSALAPEPHEHPIPFDPIATSAVQNTPSELTSQRPICRLPQEIVDNIIAALHSDEEALKSCGLTCRSWYPASRVHFFHAVSLNYYVPMHRLLALLQRSPHIAGYVRMLHIDTLLPSSSQDMLRTIVTALDRVQHLHISNTCGYDMPRLYIPAAMGSVVKLTLQTIHDTEFGYSLLFDVLPSLETLSIMGGCARNAQPIAPLQASVPPRLFELHLRLYSDQLKCAACGPSLAVGLFSSPLRNISLEFDDLHQLHEFYSWFRGTITAASVTTLRFTEQGDPFLGKPDESVSSLNLLQIPKVDEH